MGTTRINPFLHYRSDFDEEVDRFYATYPVDITGPLTCLDEQRRGLKLGNPLSEKALTYSAAADLCDVHLFSFLPFYFELQSGRSRHSWGGDGVGKWYKDNHYPEIADTAEQIRDTFEGFFGFNGLPAAVMDFDHHSLDYDTVLERGLNGIRAELEGAAALSRDPEALILYKAMIDGLNALGKISAAFSEKANELLISEVHPVARRNLGRVAAAAALCPAEPPQTFYQALNTLLFMRELIGSLEGVQVSTFGHVDRLLYPYYERDLIEGRITPEEAAELLSAFLLYTEIRFECRKARHETSTTVVLGGCDAAGDAVFNDITRMILELYGELRLMEPKLHVRLSSRHPRELSGLCAELISRNLNVLAIYNDEVVIEAVSKAGRAIEDARLYIGGGCQENKLQNCEINSRATLSMNVPKLFETIFDPNSVHAIASIEHLSLKTMKDCVSFDALYAALLNNGRKMAEALVRRRNTGEEKGAQINPCPILSAVTGDCIAKGMDIFGGGARYSFASIGLTGMATFIDSLLSIKKIVFTDKMMSLEEFGEVLAQDFAGHESLKLYIRSRMPKYGSDDPEARSLSARVFTDMARAVSGFPNGRGGRYEPSLFSHTRYMSFGRATSATPDGRARGDYLSKGIGPSFISLGDQWQTGQILDTLGDIDLTDFPVIGIVDLKLPRIPESAAHQLIIPIIERFISNGGSVLQINCIDSEELKSAQKHPERHANLVVRVSGFSATFVSLPKELQDEIIARSSCVGV